VYIQEYILLNGLYLPSIQLSHGSRGKPSLVIQQRIDTLLMIEEEREKEKSKFISHQHIVNILFDKHKAREEF
jgi:hypothetical protein